MFEIPPDIHPWCVPLAFLLGTWEGEGIVEYPTVQRRAFAQRLEFAQNGKPFLHYLSRTWEIDTDGQKVRPLAMETGFWRIGEEKTLEVLLSHPTGFLEALYGEVRGPRIELATKKVVKVESAKDYRRGHRLYGLVDGRLMWAFDMEAVDQKMQPHASAELKRVP